MVRDSPYDVDYEDYSVDSVKIQGDRMNRNKLRTFLAIALGSYHAIAKKHCLALCMPRSQLATRISVRARSMRCCCPIRAATARAAAIW